ncbi:glycine zipper 2TM domain-containing protein [Frateuria soli]|uniref:glycine zipper 2TM domain-containing protein n=1 Tax=Frateuria soli TaxID=1542730 RepID=UPI001E49231E|nr:glycine zipper 2TM domain-containing protein [Frateuria soli]UGB36962.1 glycine zipper 2TM domain-containing protein [Frateuria soli]
MNKMLLPVLALVLATGAVQAQDGRYAEGDDANTHYGWADVLRVDPVYGVARSEVPRQECYDEPVVRREGGNTTAGTVLGAVIGGVLGNTVGKGDGRKAATVAGAVAGGAVGHGVAGRGGREYDDTVTRCRQVSSVSEQRRLMGYDVEYRYHGDVYVSRLNYDPGERLRVRVSVAPAE